MTPRKQIQSQDAPAIVWFRSDLRLADNPALDAALRTGRSVLPLFIWPGTVDSDWGPGAASQVWLHASLGALDQSLEKLGSRLVLRTGNAADVLQQLLSETGARQVFWNRRYEPHSIAQDTAIKEELKRDGIIVESFNAALLHEPWEVQTRDGKPFQVFTAFWKNCLQRGAHAPPLPAPARLIPPERGPRSETLAELHLLPSIDWTKGIRAAWTPGEVGAHAQLDRFLSDSLDKYVEGRDVPALESTSRLSPHLHFGEIGPRQVWHRLQQCLSARASANQERGAEKFLSELGWREFAHHLLYHFPHTTDKPLRDAFERFPWSRDTGALQAWQRGRTGYPIVDAGMRELWETGWMHNRVRMIVASFLTKDLLIPWQDGATWFWDTLVDANLANNTLGWQWTAGCGADAAPYFRIFNPVSQGEKFDPDGTYVRRFCPELARLPNHVIHRPWDATADVLEDAGVALGKTYPERIVQHDEARKRALALFETIKKR